MASVFASAGSHGRERVCATLLSSPKGFSAARIVAELPTLPTDREHAAGPARDRAAIDAAWARAYAEPPTARGF
ncbi:MAG TPA: hypothetical protein VHG29_10230 [Novosphingobium sp.]|nr:hypothetical protein [Novosphingobium sp.]